MSPPSEGPLAAPNGFRKSCRSWQIECANWMNCSAHVLVHVRVAHKNCNSGVNQRELR